MKAKRLSALVSVILLFINVNAPVYAAGRNNVIRADEKAMYDYYRACDEQTGQILEKYDTLINGKNDIDYVDLATSLSMDKSDRIEAMYFITEIYSATDAEERAFLKSYVKSYAPYTNEIALTNFADSLDSKRLRRSNAAYLGSLAKDYALTYYNSTNPNYPNLRNMGGDCANFVSQCLVAGGKSMAGNWYIYKKNNTYPSPSNSTQLDYSWTLANPSPWISANEFNNYWSNNATTYTYSVTDYAANHATIYYNSIIYGDVVQLLKPVLWWYEGYHTMLIVDYDTTGKDYIYAAHSNDTKNSSILGKICGDPNGAYNNYQLKFFHIS